MPLDLDPQPAAGRSLAMNSKALVDHRVYTIVPRRMP
jgi:hypothetical protein